MNIITIRAIHGRLTDITNIKFDGDNICKRRVKILEFFEPESFNMHEKIEKEWQG